MTQVKGIFQSGNSFIKSAIGSKEGRVRLSFSASRNADLTNQVSVKTAILQDKTNVVSTIVEGKKGLAGSGRSLKTKKDLIEEN